jgi:hypothetical protein
LPAGPAWLRRLFGEDSFRNVTQVNVANCDEPSVYIDHVARLPALDILVVGGPAFTDEHLERLHGLMTLSGLVLDCTDVTAEGIASLRKKLRSLEVYQSERREIAALNELGGSLQTQTNLAHPRIEELIGRQWFDEATHASFRRLGLSYAGPFPQCRDGDLTLLKKLTHLRMVLLDNALVTDAGLEHLAGMKHLHSLQLVRL